MDPRPVTERMLGSVCHVLEDAATRMGREATVVALFQDAAHFEPVSTRYARLAAAGATVVVACSGDGPAVPGVHRVRLDPVDPLSWQWSFVLLSPTVGAYVTGTHLEQAAPAAQGADRLVDSAWGIDRFHAADLAERLVGDLADSLPAVVVQHTLESAAAARSAPPSVTEFALGELSTNLVEAAVLGG